MQRHVGVVGFRKPVDHLSPTCDPGNIRIGYQCGPNLHPRKPQAPPERRPSATHSPPARSISVAQCTLRRATRWQLCRHRLSYEIMENHGQSEKNRTRSKGAGEMFKFHDRRIVDFLLFCFEIRSGERAPAGTRFSTHKD